MWEKYWVIFFSQELVRIFYIEINGNLIFNLQIFTLQTVFNHSIMFINQGMVVSHFRITYNLHLQGSMFLQNGGICLQVHMAL
jgi:hypothetical protein